MKCKKGWLESARTVNLRIIYGCSCISYNIIYIEIGDAAVGRRGTDGAVHRSYVGR
jgi:hypothetical protein